MIRKLFKSGYYCPNCSTKLIRKFMFRDEDECFNHYIYSCNKCKYNYAAKEYKGNW